MYDRWSTKPSIAPATCRDNVPRGSLVQRLNEGRSRRDGGFSRKLTLVAAPAGFGKTTWVADWVHSVDMAGGPPTARSTSSGDGAHHVPGRAQT